MTENVFAKSDHKHQTVDYITVSSLAQEMITSSLKEHLAELSKDSDPSVQDLQHKLCGIRISMPSKGCGGVSHEIEFAYKNVNILEEDEMLRLTNGVAVFIDPQKSFLLVGLVLDYEDNGVEYGFKFNNPNESHKCKCGSSSFFTYQT